MTINWRKIFRRTLLTLFTVSIMLFTAVVGAKIQMYTASGEDYANEIESQDIAKLRARDKAIKNATKQAGVYLKTYSRTVNSELTDDEITAITSNAWQLVGEPKYTRTLKQISDNTTIILWTATVEVNVDDSEIQSWIKRDEKDKSTIISQTNEAIKASEENDKKIEDLREKYNRATSQTERDSIIKHMNDADRDFLANQKLKEGNKLYYAKDYEESIKLYNEALELNSNYVDAYNNRGLIYRNLKQYERAIQDLNKAIDISPNYNTAYNNLGLIYNDLGQHEQAIKYLDKAIELNPNNDYAYDNRGYAYLCLKQYDRAFQDFDKAIELNPNNDTAYNNRGVCYNGLEQYERAIQDFNKAIELNPNDYMVYNNRGYAYAGLGQYEKAILDLNKATELNPDCARLYFNRSVVYAKLDNAEKAFADINKAIELDANDADMYQMRGYCYQQLGDEEKAQADFAKAKELGYNG